VNRTIKSRALALLGAACASALLASCAAQEAGSVESLAIDSGGTPQTKPSTATANGDPPRLTGKPTTSGDVNGGGVQRFEVGTDRVDSATQISHARQSVVEQAVMEYLADSSDATFVSAQAADEFQRRSAAYAVVNDRGAQVHLALTVELTKGVWEVTHARALDLSAPR
jgi:hypothetical protein